jgi:ribonuclease III
LLERALTHRSHGPDHNERLEFLGDGVLGCAVADELYQRFPQLPEGKLTQLRASLVRRDSLARVARELELAGRVRAAAITDSVLADCVEALIGAIFLDGGYAAARRAVVQAFGPLLDAVDPGKVEKDAKTRLQELMHARGKPAPLYRVIATHGAPHERSFEVECVVEDARAEGRGTSRQRAEQDAAKAILEKLE